MNSFALRAASVTALNMSVIKEMTAGLKKFGFAPLMKGQGLTSPGVDRSGLKDSDIDNRKDSEKFYGYVKFSNGLFIVSLEGKEKSRGEVTTEVKYYYDPDGGVEDYPPEKLVNIVTEKSNQLTKALKFISKYSNKAPVWNSGRRFIIDNKW